VGAVPAAATTMVLPRGVNAICELVAMIRLLSGLRSQSGTDQSLLWCHPRSPEWA